MDSNSAIWGEIDRSESFLVASMYEEAASVASSVLERISLNNVANESIDALELNDMKVSAGMVFVQSLNQLDRASDILNELKVLFCSAAAVPVQVLLAGVCFQISEGSSLGVREFFEEFLSKWHFVNEKFYVFVRPNVDDNVQQELDDRDYLGIDEYMEVVEIYAVTLLGTALKDLDHAIAWVEKAGIPEERRQGLLRKLHSLYSIKMSNCSQCSSSLPASIHELHGSSSKEFGVSDGSSKVSGNNVQPNSDKRAILRLSNRNRKEQLLWWFPSINLKIGNRRLVVTNGKIFLGCLIFLTYYVLRRKKATIKAIMRKQVMSIKKALVDLWQLTFSYQVNPLAAVQPLPNATRGR
ncbi:3-phosphoinositide-dependent protein kinase-1 putative [Euphorbia peplus]|nr:3-phosphoinositide-dependent protein kinase-1 putative [Euphorbia peplus]